VATAPQQQSRSEERYWLVFAVLLVFLLSLAAVRWMLEHPYGIHADESWYINEAQIDVHIFHGASLHDLGWWLVHQDPSRPPAYRLIVLPFLAVFGYHTVIVRLVTFGCFVISAWFIYLTTKRFAGPIAAAIAILVFCLSPDVLAASIFFSTEGPLYVAVAATLFFLSVYWSDGPEPRGNWIGLGLAMGLGLLSKITFASLAGPVFLFSAFTTRRHQGRSGLVSLGKAAVLSLLVAIPWWRRDIGPALGYANFTSRGFLPRYTLGSHFAFLTWERWLSSVVLGLIGPGIAIVILLVGIVYVRKITTGERIAVAQRTALYACGCAGLPIVVAQLLGTDYLLRHISPAVIPLAVAIGALSEGVGWVRSRIAMAATGLLFFIQFVMLVLPVMVPNKHTLDYAGMTNGFFPWGVMIRSEQWNWSPLLDISNSCGLPTPTVSYMGNGAAFDRQIQYSLGNYPVGNARISYLGNGRALSGLQMQYPWLSHGLAAPNLVWLWRLEDGPINWEHVMDLAGQSDIIVTAPHYVGQSADRNEVDNQHNEEFAKRLSEDPRFRGPIHLEMGQLDPVDVLVFVKATIGCHSMGASLAKP
jgi:4-amino-4-deoxy-L-arabinose transferase-like glycosyltransferase